MARTMTAAWIAAGCAVMLSAGQGSAADVKAAAVKKAAAPAAKAPAAKAPAATLTGCLHADGTKFVLTDMPENQAPKARSWKTAYITKSEKDVEVVSSASSLKLKDHVGHKVTVSGMRDGTTHFKATSVKQIARSCS